MVTSALNFFKPPELGSFETTQKVKFLHTTLLVITAACLILGVQNLSAESNFDLFLFLVGGISFLCIPLNKRGYYKPISVFIAALLFGGLTYSLIDGVGLKDAGLVAYPVYIIFASFFFNKKATFAITSISIGSVFFVYFLDRMGYLKPAKYSNEAQLKIICILFITTGILVWAIMDNLERIYSNLRETCDLTLIGWVKALEYRDRETEGHSQRVVGMTMELAKRFKIPESTLEHIRRGVLLHDIGKMAVPDAILLKNGSLTDSEWEIVKMHPIYAKQMIENIPFLKPALDIPYSHQERWDGSGYPEGLSKEAIPLAARIFAVVDVWDALTSERPYHKAWPEEKAREYIQDQSGRLFDPNVVGAFLDLFRVI